MTATITVDRLWLNAADDESDAIGIKLAAFTPSDAAEGEIRVYASGRRRLVIKGDGRLNKTFEAVLSHPTSDERAWLAAHVGQLVIVRDPDGGKFAGAYLEFSPPRTPVPIGENVPLIIKQVTHSEAV